MKTRSEKLKRLVAVQRHLERMAETELAETSRQRKELAETMDVVVDAMGSVHEIHRMFSGLYSGQLNRLHQKDQMLSGIQQVQETRVVKERTKADRLNEHMIEARNGEDREAADNAIYDVIDQRFAAMPPASGKLDGR
ncbi:hypothetical protein [Pararhizobium sp.]|uniref:hypothetical protein n=1 Tax=Pararhizobium sp. TaxID=1977563 RepID=UPI0027251FB4|nr:hypothetical protein [Pararhizobium sp.]MDO9418259.1 hypothetical protein [Pararhizobium sp.]